MMFNVGAVCWNHLRTVTTRLNSAITRNAQSSSFCWPGQPERGSPVLKCTMSPLPGVHPRPIRLAYIVDANMPVLHLALLQDFLCCRAKDSDVVEGHAEVVGRHVWHRPRTTVQSRSEAEWNYGAYAAEFREARVLRPWKRNASQVTEPITAHRYAISACVWRGGRLWIWLAEPIASTVGTAYRVSLLIVCTDHFAIFDGTSE